MKKIILVVILFCSLQVTAQVDSVRYYKQKYDSAAYKLIAARVCILNVQNFLNDCKGKHQKNSIYIMGWTARILDDYYNGGGIRYKSLVKPIKKTKKH